VTDCNEEERKDSFATVIGSAITLMVIVIIAFGWHPPAPMAFATPTPTLTPTLTLTSDERSPKIGRASPFPLKGERSSSTPTPTLTPTSTPTSTPTPTTMPALSAPKDHYWLAYPLADRQRHVSRYYPYGSTAGGELQFHHGVDIQSPTGTPILAVAEGTIIVAGDDHSRVYGPTTDFYGNLVIMRLDREFHGQPVFCLYGHLSKVIARAGQRVKPGDALGEVGETGVAMGPHLHFEVRVGGNTYDDTRNPELWLEPLPGHGTIAGKVLGADCKPSPLASCLPTLRLSSLCIYGETTCNHMGAENLDTGRGEGLQDGEPIPGALITFHRAEAPDERWREAWTYPAYDDELSPHMREDSLSAMRGESSSEVNPDEEWGENFAMGDVPVGTYILRVRIGGMIYTRKVAVSEGETSFVVIQGVE